MSEQKHYSFTDGLPTGPDVELLMKTWPEMKVGDRFDYGSIERLIGVTWDTPRFKTVTMRWRKRWQDKNVVIECAPGEAFYVASMDQVSSRSYEVFRFVGRKAKVHRRKLASFKPESEAERGLIEHQCRLFVGIEREAKKSRMNLLPATDVKETPKITPPKKSNG